MSFDNLRYFKETENWGDASKMNGALLMILDEIRHQLDKPIVIHCGYETSGHSEYSEHYDGNAVDFHVVGAELKSVAIRILDILQELQVDNRVGFGVYLDWNNKGFHLDLRGRKARWARIEGEYVNIKKSI